MGRELGKGMAKPGDMLFGRRTWQDFITAWGRATDGNPFTTQNDSDALPLIDNYRLLIHPLTLGSGAQLFEGPAPLTEFELTDSVTTSKGVIIAHYARR
jgi:hypothetical protein